MANSPKIAADPTAVRTALWRALHLQVDSKPSIIEDPIGLQLAAPADGWQARPDMHPQGTSGFRAGIVSRARFVEDLVREEYKKGIHQYVILGAGLDSFAQREAKNFPGLKIFEVDQPGTQEWKRQRLVELNFGISESLKLVPVDFEAGDSWWEKLLANGFDAAKPAVIASTGVSLYLTKEANLATLKQIAQLAPGTTLAMSFYLPMDLIPAAERPLQEMVQERAKMAGTPFISFFTPTEIKAMAIQAGFKKTAHVSRDEIIQRYFQGRSDGLLPASGEEFLVTTNLLMLGR